MLLFFSGNLIPRNLRVHFFAMSLPDCKNCLRTPSAVKSVCCFAFCENMKRVGSISYSPNDASNVDPITIKKSYLFELKFFIFAAI
jgi:hypothetical protein